MRSAESILTDLYAASGQYIAGVSNEMPQQTLTQAQLEDERGRVEQVFDTVIPDNLAETVQHPNVLLVGSAVFTLGAAKYAYSSWRIRRKIKNVGSSDSDLRRQASGKEGEKSSHTQELKNDRRGYRMGAALVGGAALFTMAASQPIDEEEVRLKDRVTLVAAAGEDATARDITNSQGSDFNRYEGPLSAIQDVVQESDGLEVNIISANPDGLSSSLFTEEQLSFPDTNSRSFIGPADMPSAIEAAQTAGTPVIIFGSDFSGLDTRRAARDLHEDIGDDSEFVALGSGNVPIEVQGEAKIAQYEPRLDNAVDGLDIQTANSVEEIKEIIEDFDESNTEVKKSIAPLFWIFSGLGAAILATPLVSNRIRSASNRFKVWKLQRANKGE